MRVIWVVGGRRGLSRVDQMAWTRVAIRRNMAISKWPDLRTRVGGREAL